MATTKKYPLNGAIKQVALNQLEDSINLFMDGTEVQL